MGLFVSSSDVLLFVYKNTIDIYMLFFYPATSLNLLTRSSRFLVESLGFSIYITSWQIDGKKVELSGTLYFLGLQNHRGQ